MINDCIKPPGIIKDYSKMTDNQLEVNVQKGYEKAILELARREGRILLYEMPDGTWAASAEGTISDGFASKDTARQWVYKQLEEKGWRRA